MLKLSIFCLLTIQCAAMAQTAKFTLSQRLQDGMSLRFRDNEYSGGFSVRWTNLTANVYLDSSNQMVRVIGYATGTQDVQQVSYTTTRAVVQPLPNPPIQVTGAVTVRLALPTGGLFFDTGYRPLTWDQSIGQYTFDGGVLATIPVVGSFTLVTGGRTYSTNFSYALNAAAGGAFTFTRLSTTNYPVSLVMSAFGWTGGMFSYSVGVDTAAQVTADNGFPVTIKPGMQMWGLFNGESFNWSFGAQQSLPGGAGVDYSPTSAYPGEAPLLPTITTQPASTTANAGGIVNFSVAATGKAPLTYQWQFNGSALAEGGAISGSTSNLLVLWNVATNQSGNYSVIVSNGFGGITSIVTTLVVSPLPVVPPTITQQPQGQSVNQGSPVSFSVIATGTNLGFQWRFNSVTVFGATNASYNLASATTNDAGTYSVIVSNGGGSITSSNAVLIVWSTNNPAPLLVVSNANYGLITNQQPTFTVATTNGTMLEEFDYIVTGPFDHTTLALLNGDIYKITISGRASVGPNVGDPNSTPDVAYMFVNWQNLDLVHVPDSWICTYWDGIASRRPFPDVYNTNHVYDYYVMGIGTGLAFSFRDNPYWDNIGGFHVRIFNLGSPGVITPPPTITSQPVNQTVNQGNPASFSVTATGTGLGFQWRLNTVSISGATNASYNIASATTNHAGTYAVIVSNAGGSVTSSNAVLTVIPPPRTGTGTATLFDVFVVAVNITDGGSGYTNPPLVRLIGGGGSGAQAVAVVSNGVITAITMRNAGYGYTSTPLVVIDPPFILNPVLDIAPMSFLTFSNLTVGGVYQLQRSVAWYWTNEPVSFTAAEVTYTEMVAGLASSGDYRLALNPVPAQAFATAQVVNGFCVGAMVTSGGSGYVTSPAVSIVGGGGTNATAVSYTSGGVVTSIGITSAGIGYTNTPTVEIEQPPAAAVSPTVLPVMRVDAARLAPYNNYQIQFKPALGGPWQNWADGLFAPTDVTSSQYLFITNSAGFVRLQHVP